MNIMVLSENASNHNKTLAKYHNNIVKEFNSLRSIVLKKQLIKDYIQDIKDTINKGRGIRRTQKNKDKNKGKNKGKGNKSKGNKKRTGKRV